MSDEQPTWWETFKGWHGDSKLWREIYARTVSALIAALVIYLFALATGVVSHRPAILVFAALTVLAVLTTEVGDGKAGDRGFASECSVAAVMVVVMQPDRERGDAVGL